MTQSELCNTAAQAADPNVIGCAVLKPDRTIESGWHVYTRADAIVVRIDTADGSAPIQAAIDAVLAADLSAAGAVAGDKQQSQQQAATAFALSTNYEGRLLRAAALVLVDEINALRGRLRAQDAAIAAATSLADLKTRWAALAAVPDRTAQQAKAAIQTKINSTDSD